MSIYYIIIRSFIFQKCHSHTHSLTSALHEPGRPQQYSTSIYRLLLLYNNFTKVFSHFNCGRPLILPPPGLTSRRLFVVLPTGFRSQRPLLNPSNEVHRIFLAVCFFLLLSLIYSPDTYVSTRSLSLSESRRMTILYMKTLALFVSPLNFINNLHIH